MGTAGGVGADQGAPAAPELPRQLGQCHTGDLDVVGGAVAARPARPQQPRDRLSGAAASVVDEGHEPVVAVCLLPGPSGVLLVGVGQHQHAVDVHDHLPVGVRSLGPGQLPDPVTDFGPCGADGGQCPRARCGERVDQSGNSRVGGYRPEDGRFGPQHRDIGQAVPAQGGRQREVHQDLARVVHRPRLAPRRQGRGYRLIQAGFANRLHQQHGTRLRDHRTAVALDSDRRIRPATLLHPGSASLLATNRTFDKPYRPSSEQCR